jgi:Leucine-rich repeat (LRR) protein
LTYLPELNEELKSLYCCSNQLKELPKLNHQLKILDCCRNKLEQLPKLNNALKCLYCDGNRLKTLPSLNNNLKLLHCGGNQLTYLPNLNNQLTKVRCGLNPLTRLPPIVNESMKEFEYSYTPVYHLFDGISIHNLGIMNRRIRILNNFIMRFHCLKFRTKFRDFLWLRVRQRIAAAHYSPANLQLLLNSMEDPDDDEEHDRLIDSW